MAGIAYRVSRPALAAALGLAALTGGCITLPSARPEAGALPSAWRDAPQGAETEAAALADWWTSFNDPVLTALVEEGLADGPSVQIAALRVREARAVSWTQIARFFPEVTATGVGQYTRVNEGAPLISAGGGAETEQGLASYGAQVSWEIPLFSFPAATVGAAANARKARADERGAQVALAADIAQAYVDLRSAQASRRAVEESVAHADRLVSILDISARAGFAAEADAADARRQAESQRARLPGFAIEMRRAESVLAVLRGHAPGTETEEIAAQLSAQGDVPSLPIARAPAAPADLVRLRPDVASAEQQALLAVAQLGAARADLLPRLNLTGAINVTDNVIGTGLATSSERVTATPIISLPLFDWGQRLAVVSQRNSQLQQALIGYKQTVNQAVAEATNALAALDQGARRLESARIAETAAQTTLRGRRAAYEAGLLSLADLLRAEQQTIDARLTRIDSESAQARAGIAVYRAFGGGPALAPSGS